MRNRNDWFGSLVNAIVDKKNDYLIICDYDNKRVVCDGLAKIIEMEKQSFRTSIVGDWLWTLMDICTFQTFQRMKLDDGILMADGNRLK